MQCRRRGSERRPAVVLDAGSSVDGTAKHPVTIMSEPSIDLSVVVPVYNGEAFIERTMVELIAFISSLDKPSELIVIDDGSADGGETTRAAKTRRSAKTTRAAKTRRHTRPQAPRDHH